MKYPEHGANPALLFEALQLNPHQERIDFSVNVNPLGAPAVLEKEWQQLYPYILDYPEPQARSLRNAIAQKELLLEDMILIGNGGSEIIYLVARLFRNHSVLIVEPTFSEYRKACTSEGVEVEHFLLSEEHDWQLDLIRLFPRLVGKKAVFLAHPNNPTGVVYERETLQLLIEHAASLGVTVVLDEAFYDFCEQDCSMLSELERYPNLIILRSFTKMYVIAGIRLGVLFAHTDIVARLAQLQPEWSVNQLAIQIGHLCLYADEHVERTRTYITAERQRVQEKLKQLGFIISKSGVNFYLLRTKEKQDLNPLLRYLAENGIVARHTHNFPGLDGCYLRFAVRTREENDQLLLCLEGWL